MAEFIGTFEISSIKDTLHYFEVRQYLQPVFTFQLGLASPLYVLKRLVLSYVFLDFEQMLDSKLGYHLWNYYCAILTLNYLLQICSWTLEHLLKIAFTVLTHCEIVKTENRWVFLYSLCYQQTRVFRSVLDHNVLLGRAWRLNCLVKVDLFNHSNLIFLG